MLAHVFLEHDAEKELHGLEAGLIHMLRRGQHGADFHVKRPQALVAVAQGGVDESNFVAHLASGKWFKSFNGTQFGFDSPQLFSTHLRVRHSRMLLSLDFPRDGEVLEPSGIQARPNWTPDLR